MMHLLGGEHAVLVCIKVEELSVDANRRRE